MPRNGIMKNHDFAKKERKEIFFFKEKMKTCLLSFSGNPLPRLTWYKSGSLIDETYDILSNGTVRNEITFHSIERSFLRTKLTCEASNTNLTRPTSTTVNVDMNCKFYKNTRIWLSLDHGRDLSQT